MVKLKGARKLGAIIGMIVGFVVMVGVGGLFVNGTFLNVFLLKYLPEVVHTIVGYIIIAGAILSGVLSLFK